MYGLRILAAKVYEDHQRQHDAAYDAKCRSQIKGGGRSDRVRTYNFIDSRVVDHRLGKKTKPPEEIYVKAEAKKQ